MRYAGYLIEFLGDSWGFTPKSGVVNVTLIYTPKVKNVEVAVNPGP